MKKKVLFLCTGNSCRSQMAEGWLRALRGDNYEVYSAGIETHGLNLNAVKVMAEVGVDISSHQSSLLDDVLKNLESKGQSLEYVVTVCGHAHENCPVFLGDAKVVHVGFDDPPKLAAELAEDGGDIDAQLDCYRRVRDEIKGFVESFERHLG
ncbi:arsenate reductase ArsC [Marinicella rhabdoformis]|uniref:arsenate reductase ArsC n=1 Tax=Marinicella rhabdoformis TaxID=2580566 RepID=UPI0012AED51C|nr:arsenate reductase ArsC [Marinicella rhabdoformis]